MKLIPYETILLAKSGNEDAVLNIISAFRNFIDRRCTSRHRDEAGIEYVEIDEDLQQICKIALLKAISGFKPKEKSSNADPGDTDYIRATQLKFIKYSAKSIENALIDAKEYRRKLDENEFSLEDIPQKELMQELIVAATEIEDTDRFLTEPYEFDVLGRKIQIHDRNLGDALRFQAPYLRNPFLAKIFFNLTDKELSSIYNKSESTIVRHRKQMKEKLKGYLSSDEM